MARIRSVKPEIWKHEELSTVPESTMLLALALLNYSDDYGYFNANPALIKAECFPLREPLVSIPESLAILSGIGYVRLAGSGSRSYGHLVNFDKHQRVSHPTPSKFKDIPGLWNNSGIPPETFRSPPEPLVSPPETFVKPPETFVPDRNREGSKEREGNKNQNPTTTLETEAACDAAVSAKYMKKAAATEEEKPWIGLAIEVKALYIHANLHPPYVDCIHGWGKHGFDFELSRSAVLAKVSAQIALRDPIMMLDSYFTKLLGAKHTTKNAVANGFGPVSHSPPPAPEIPEAEWHRRLDKFEESKGTKWYTPFGATPNTPGTRVPQSILIARGYRDEHGRPVPNFDPKSGIVTTWGQLVAETTQNRPTALNSITSPKAAKPPFPPPVLLTQATQEPVDEISDPAMIPDSSQPTGTHP